MMITNECEPEILLGSNQAAVNTVGAVVTTFQINAVSLTIGEY